MDLQTSSKAPVSNDNEGGAVAGPVKRPRKRANASQMELPLGEALKARVGIIPMDDIHGSQIHTWIAHDHPIAIIDTRHFTRFDIPGTTRASIFSAFRATGAEYKCIPIEWHNVNHTRYANVYAPSISKIVKVILNKSQVGSTTILVQKHEHGNFLAEFIEKIARSSHTSIRIEVIV